MSGDTHEPGAQVDPRLALSLGCGALLLVAWLGEGWWELSHGWAVALYLASGACGAWELVRSNLAVIRDGRYHLDIDLLMLLAACGAAAVAVRRPSAIACAVSSGEPAANGCAPMASSWRAMPSAKMSLAAVAGSPWICSGDM